MIKRVGVVLICLAVLITSLGLSANAFTYAGIKGAVEGVTASVDTIKVDVAFFELLAHAFRGFFSGTGNHFAIVDDHIYIDDSTGEYFGIVETVPENLEEHIPYFARVYLGTNNEDVALDRWQKIIKPFEAMHNIANWNTSRDVWLISDVTEVVKMIGFVLASVWCLISVIVQVVFDVFNIAIALVRGVFRIIGLAPSA